MDEWGLRPTWIWVEYPQSVLEMRDSDGVRNDRQGKNDGLENGEIILFCLFRFFLNSCTGME